MRAPRPVAGLPALEPSELAKAWLLEIVAGGSLEDAARIDTAAFARDAPAFCAAVLAALGEDAALPRRAPGDVEALRQVMTRALRAAVLEREVALDAVDRLAHVCTRLAPADAPPAIAAHDQRDSWPLVVGRALERHAGDDEPFAILAGEVADRERWLAADPAAIERAEAAVTASLRPGDRLIREQPGRWWLIAPGTDADGARALATALADAAEAAGAAGVAFGVAACPRDGVDAEALTAHADEALFSARAAGLPVV